MERPKKSLLLAATVAALSGILLGFSCNTAKRQAEAEPQKLRLAVIPMGTTHEFWKAIHAGAKKAAGRSKRTTATSRSRSSRR
jgi:ribose transport system substrate-binding protein